MSSGVVLTVFTPAYNRAHTLIRTYDSLKRQTSKAFIWMIIDDGSTDNTAQLVKQWMTEEPGFEILYYYKPNGGMHTAHNLAYRMISTEINVCIDSDDYMPENAVADILSFWAENGSENVAGIIALDSDISGKIIGTLLPRSIKQATTRELYENYKISGDKKLIYRTEIIRSVPEYPEFLGERLVPLGYKYELIADEYPMLLLNKSVCIVDYQPDGSSRTILKQYLQSPRGFAADRIIRMTRTKRTRKRLKYIIHYIAECRIAKDNSWYNNTPFKMQTLLLYPFGVLTEWLIRFKNKSNK